MCIVFVPIIFLLLHFIYISAAFAYGKFRIQFHNTADDSNKYTIEHIVCFKNESSFIQKKLENSYLLETMHDIHHTFVNDNSTDDTLNLLHSFKNGNTTILSNSTNLGKNQSQIKAVNRSESDLILFTDANVFLQPDAVDKLIRVFEPDIGGITGNVKITTDLAQQDFSGKYWEIEKKIKKFQSSFGAVIGFDGGFYCIRRENYYLKRENELSDFESAFLIFENGKKTLFVQDAMALELERRTLRNSFKSRVRASNRILWSFFRIFRYIHKLEKRVLFHFFFHKICRYMAAISLIMFLPMLVGMLFSLPAPFLLILLVPWLWRILFECTALCVGGIVALSGKEYRTWSHTK